MEKEFELLGLVYSEKIMSVDRFTDEFIEFVESENWYFGGGMNESTKKTELRVQGCVSVDENVTHKDFYNKLQNFANANMYKFECSIHEIIDGFYINENGSKGDHVLDSKEE